MRLSKNLTLREAIKSNTATRLGIDNTPEEWEIHNLRAVAENVFQPVRDHFGVPIAVSSGYRSKKLNKAIGGSSMSQHCEGRAMDLDDTFGHKTNAQMFFYIKKNLNFDTLIWEFGDDDNPDWIHVSWVSNDENRTRCLRAEKFNGRTSYKMI